MSPNIHEPRAPHPDKFQPKVWLVARWLDALGLLRGRADWVQAHWLAASMHVAAAHGDFKLMEQPIQRDGLRPPAGAVDARLPKLGLPVVRVDDEEDRFVWSLVVRHLCNNHDKASALETVYRLGGWRAAEPLVNPIVDGALQVFDANHCEIAQNAELRNIARQLRRHHHGK